MSAEKEIILENIRELMMLFRQRGFPPVILYVSPRIFKLLKDNLGFCHDGDWVFEGTAVVQIPEKDCTLCGWSLATCAHY